MKRISKLFILCSALVAFLFISSCSTKKYTVNFYVDGEIYKTVEIAEKGLVGRPADPVKADYDFKLWSKVENSNVEYDFKSQVMGDLNLYAYFEKTVEANKYDVVFNVDGEVYDTKKVTENTKVTLPEEPTKTDYKFTGWFVDDTLETLFDENTVVTSNMELYAGFEYVYETYVYSVAQNENFVLFNANSKEQANKHQEFFDLNVEYTVGDDNNFVVMPNMSFLKRNKYDIDDYEILEECAWTYSYRLYLVDDLTTMVNDLYVENFDENTCEINFNESAIGHSFKIVVYPNNLTEKQTAKFETYSISFAFKVEDGYNAYTALDLAYIENRPMKDGSSISKTATAWAEFKEQNNIDPNYLPTAIYFHTNISVDAQSVPQFFTYTAEDVKGAEDADRAVGSLRDNYNLYIREQNSGSFTMNGNLFAFDASALPVVVRESGKVTPPGEVISHTTLFRFEGNTSFTANFVNTNYLGNAPRVEDAIKAGGIILTKVDGPNFNATNCISVSWFICWFPENLGVFTVNKVKSYDSYNSFIYNWGNPNTYINDCEMIGAGGPVIIQDHVDYDKADSLPAHTFIKNSNLQSYVTGKEGWFKAVHADSLVPTIVGLDAYFTPFGRSFLKTNSDKTYNFFNLLCVNKASKTDGLSTVKISGEVRFDETTSFDYGTTNPYLAGLLDNTFKLGAPAFQTSAGGYCYGTTTGLFDVQNKQIIDPTNDMFKGDYLGLYYQGSLITLGYYTYNGSYEVI